MNKHAYLILAHNQFELLGELVKSLDDERNDIYIHIDNKIEWSPDVIELNVRNSNVYFAKRENVYWGHISIVNATYNLLKWQKIKAYISTIT